MELNLLQNSTMRLRALEPDDLDFLYRLENDPSVWEVSNTIAPYSKFVLKQYLQNAHKDIYEVKQLRLVLELVDNNATIGFVDLFDFDPRNQRVGLGIIIHDESDKRKGYAKSAINLLKTYCFSSLDVHQVFANIGQDNLASQALFEGCGFVQTGIKKDWIKVKNQYKDELIYQCLNA